MQDHWLDDARTTAREAMANPEFLLLLGMIGETLDGLEVATCVYDDDDCALLWNRTFLHFFPEHAGRIHAGEPYRSNLRRFYQGRLNEEEMPFIERYIDEGIARHRAQRRPFAFEHRGMRLLVASLPLEGLGRIRIWKSQGGPPVCAQAPALGVAAAERPFVDDDTLFRHLADSIMVTDAGDRIVWVNEPFAATYGLPDCAAARGIRFDDVYRTAWRASDSLDSALYESGLSILVENMRFIGAPFEVPLPNGRWTRVTHQKSLDGKGFSTHVDITVLKHQQQELRRAEQRARDSNELLEATLERMQQGVMMVNAERVVMVCNRRAIELLGLPESLMASKPLFEEVLAYQWSTDEFRHAPQSLQEFIRAGGIVDEPQCYDRKRPDGRVIEVQSVPIAGGGVLRTYTDITDRKRDEERIRHISRHDGLTSLVNRDVFLESVAAAMVNAGRGAGTSFAIHYIDLVRFKPINDAYGHAVGDKVLSLVANRMRRVARDRDVVSRMGGDEFAILQRDVENRDAALGLAHRILAGVAQPMDIEAHRLQVGVSIGIAFFPGPARDVDTLLRNADSAMYAAKASGRECVRAFGDAGCDVAGQVARSSTLPAAP